MTKLERLLILHEGLRLKPYRCTAGKLTIGCGRNLDDNPLRAYEIKRLGRSDLSGGITREEAFWLLREDLSRTEASLFLRFPWWAKLDPVRKAVLADMGYCMGVGKLHLGWPNTMQRAADGKWDAFAHHLEQSKWAKQVGDGPGKRRDRCDRLAEMARTGQWPADLPEYDEAEA